MKTICVFLAEGFEEVEGLTVVDLLRRAEQKVITASISKEKTVFGSHNIPVTADELAEQVDFSQVDMLVLPGGLKGTQNLEADELVQSQIRAFYEAGKYVTAICAAPSILGKAGLLKGKRATSYPGFEQYLEGAQTAGNPVEVDGNVITGRSMGAAIDFGLALIEALDSRKKAEEIAEQIVYHR